MASSPPLGTWDSCFFPTNPLGCAVLGASPFTLLLNAVCGLCFIRNLRAVFLAERRSFIQPFVGVWKEPMAKPFEQAEFLGVGVCDCGKVYFSA